MLDEPHAGDDPASVVLPGERAEPREVRQDAGDARPPADVLHAHGGLDAGRFDDEARLGEAGPRETWTLDPPAFGRADARRGVERPGLSRHDRLVGRQHDQLSRTVERLDRRKTVAPGPRAADERVHLGPPKTRTLGEDGDEEVR